MNSGVRSPLVHSVYIHVLQGILCCVMALRMGSLGAIPGRWVWPWDRFLGALAPCCTSHRATADPHLSVPCPTVSAATVARGSLSRYNTPLLPVVTTGVNKSVEFFNITFSFCLLLKLQSLVDLSATGIHFFMGGVCRPHAQPSKKWTRVYVFVWVITFDLFGMGGPTSSYATARIAIRVTWPRKPYHRVSVVTPLGGNHVFICLQNCDVTQWTFILLCYRRFMK